ncbi:MAG: N-6 DNA methylase [Raineya sp.]|nr:N-6 DNA methylase [Raineya sp.]
MAHSELIQKGIQEGLIKFDEELKYITYLHQNKKNRYTDPEEKVQAEIFCKIVLEYGYPVNRVQQFVNVKMGVSDKEADIVVYNDDKCEQPYIVIECKKEEISEREFQEAVKQAFSYAHALAGTMKYVWVTKGDKEEFFKFDKDKNKKESIADIPYFGETYENRYKYAKGAYYYDKVKGVLTKITKGVKDLETTTENKLIQKFKQAHDALWGGGELNPSQAFDELDKLVFCKIWDERNTKRGEPYQFQVLNETPEELKSRIVELYEKGKIKDPEVFNKPIDLAPEKVKTIVEYFQSVNLSDTDLDSKGKAFETFLGTYFRGEFGQYFTPRNVVKFAVEALPITNESKVLDTSCGSGGFLLYILDKVRRQADAYYDRKDPKEAVEHYNHWHTFAEKNLFGIEINDQISRVAKMNMIIHDDGHTNVITFDGLYQIDYIAEKTGNKGFKENSFDFVATNPPFGSIVKQSEKSYMQIDSATNPYYDFALKEIHWIEKILKPKHKTTGRENQSTEVLFIEQIHHFLKEGGYAAVVIPDGILTNSSLQYVRNDIQEMFRIVAVVSLPQTAFTATGAGVKSSLLFLKKWNKEKSSKIRTQIEGLEEHLAEKHNLKSKIEALEDEKKELQKRNKKLQKALAEDIFEPAILDDTQEQINDINEQINAFKESIDEIYEEEKSKFFDYPIFMAIAENIGYDATGKDSYKVLSREEKYIYNKQEYIREVQENDLFVSEVLKIKEYTDGKWQEVVKYQTILDNASILTELRNFINAIEKGKDSFFI